MFVPCMPTTPVQQETNLYESPSRIDSGKLGEFDSYRVYGAWRFGGVQGGTGELGTFSSMLENFAKPPKSLHSAWESYGAISIRIVQMTIVLMRSRLLGLDQYKSTQGPQNRTDNVYLWAGPAELQSETYAPAHNVLTRFVCWAFRISRTVRMTYTFLHNIPNWDTHEANCDIDNPNWERYHPFLFLRSTGTCHFSL